MRINIAMGIQCRCSFLEWRIKISYKYSCVQTVQKSIPSQLKDRLTVILVR